MEGNGKTSEKGGGRNKDKPTAGSRKRVKKSHINNALNSSSSSSSMKSMGLNFACTPVVTAVIVLGVKTLMPPSPILGKNEVEGLNMQRPTTPIQGPYATPMSEHWRNTEAKGGGRIMGRPTVWDEVSLIANFFDATA